MALCSTSKGPEDDQNGISARAVFANRCGRAPGGLCQNETAALNSGYVQEKFIGDLDDALMRLAEPKDIVVVTMGSLDQYIQRRPRRFQPGAQPHRDCGKSMLGIY